MPVEALRVLGDNGAETAGEILKRVTKEDMMPQDWINIIFKQKEANFRMLQLPRNPVTSHTMLMYYGGSTCRLAA